MMPRRLPETDRDEETISCHYCGSQATEVVAEKKAVPGFEKIAGKFRQNYCNTCGLYFTEPCPSEQAIQSFFEEDYNRSRFSAGTDLEKLLAWPRTDRTLTGRLLTWAKRLRGPVVPEAKILHHYYCRSDLKRLKLIDIGCAQGQLVRVLRRLSIPANGLEPHRETVEILRRNGADYIWQGDLFSYQFPGHYDVVCLISVLTHIKDLRGAFGILHRLLKANALVLVMEMNTDRRGLNMSNPHAFNYFSARFMKRIQRDTGFDGLDIWDYRADSRSVELSAREVNRDCEARYFVFRKGHRSQSGQAAHQP